ncbi:MAG: peptidase S16 [Rhodospirillaceae bacterium]|nr:peptidase S16 [Rhodospirillaceae bacterium]
MSRGPFDPHFDDLPPSIPVFPLPSVLLLPRGKLPLNIFEPRYLAMTRASLASKDRMIGIIQPTEKEEIGRLPRLYPTGCAGRITSFSETDDGRYLLSLMGICRFDVTGELPLVDGFRRVTVGYDRFRRDLDAEETPIERDRLLAALLPYFKSHSIAVEWETVKTTPDERLVTTLSMICPFGPGEKQALLESVSLSERAKLLTALLEMAILEHSGDGARH